MARLNNHVNGEDDDDAFLSATQSPRRAQGRVNTQSLSPSPSASFSDKENQVTPRNISGHKEHSVSMGPPQRPTPDTVTRPQKKRKLAERDAPSASQITHRRQLEEVGDSRYYDPNQSMEERRAVRKEYRDLSRDLVDQRGEFLAPGSDGLMKTLHRQNELFGSVKQTSDATLDSRLLVSTADLSAKRTTQLNVGDSTTGIDVDDFVSKCIQFMRAGPSEEDSTQRRRRQEDASDEEDGQDYDEGDAFNWEYLGRQACYPNNIRPPVPGFLLGPLSVQKRVRKATQRRERLKKRDPNEAVRPEELKAQDIEKNENSNLTSICRNIRELLVKEINEREAVVQQYAHTEMSGEEVHAICRKHGIGDDAGLHFFNFVLNPKSFGQTIENLFYVSFLIRDGLVGIGNDSKMLPTLHPTDPRKGDQARTENVQKHQAVFHLDFETWEDLIEAYEIKESIIPHRQPDPAAQVGVTGWYG